MKVEQTHGLTEQVEQTALSAVHSLSPQADIDVVVHVEPAASPTETLAEQIQYLAKNQGVNAHDIHIREVSGHLEADFDLEIPKDMPLIEAHAVASHLEEVVLQNNQQLGRVNTHLEALVPTILPRQEVTIQYPELVHHLCRLADEVAGAGSTHQINVYRAQEPGSDQHRQAASEQRLPELDVVVHTTFAADAPLSKVHIHAEEIKRIIRQAHPNVVAITIHTEPPGEE